MGTFFRLVQGIDAITSGQRKVLTRQFHDEIEQLAPKEHYPLVSKNKSSILRKRSPWIFDTVRYINRRRLSSVVTSNKKNNSDLNRYANSNQ